MLDFIGSIVKPISNECETFFDLFGGTGVVSDYFNKYFDIYINDILMCNVIAYQAFFSEGTYDKEKLSFLLNGFNKINPSNLDDNYYSLNFRDTYLSRQNLKIVGEIRDLIDNLFNKKEINFKEKAILITSLIYSVDRIANTVGHYDSFRRGGNLDKKLIFKLPLINDKYNVKNKIFCEDSNKLVKEVKADIVYIDPPYNSRQYCDSYHFLENIVLNNKPDLFGVARKMDRSVIKSDYCTNKAFNQFSNLIDDIDSKYILVSYNSTGNQINSRSNAKISDDQILDILSERGEVKIFEKDFNAFTTGKTNLESLKERVFFCKVGKNSKSTNNLSVLTQEIIHSPLNYTGGKAKLLPQIIPIFPKKIKTFYDIFSGGLNVGLNISANKHVFVDKNGWLMELYRFLKNNKYSQVIKQLENLIKDYGLSNTYAYGYSYYDCDSSTGLGKFNNPGFNNLKNDFNFDRDILKFLLLIIFSFNNQIRFNSSGLFNLPVGKRDLNSSIRNKLSKFMARLSTYDIELVTADFREINLNKLLKEEAFLYLDPPYLLANASYNENGGWTKEDELDLLNFLIKCNNNGLNFALSNVLLHNGNQHDILINWCLENSFNILSLNYNYKNSNYHKKNKLSHSNEVLITNFKASY